MSTIPTGLTSEQIKTYQAYLDTIRSLPYNTSTINAMQYAALNGSSGLTFRSGQPQSDQYIGNLKDHSGENVAGTILTTGAVLGAAWLVDKLLFKGKGKNAVVNFAKKLFKIGGDDTLKLGTKNTKKLGETITKEGQKIIRQPNGITEFYTKSGNTRKLVSPDGKTVIQKLENGNWVTASIKRKDIVTNKVLTSAKPDIIDQKEVEKLAAILRIPKAGRSGSEWKLLENASPEIRAAAEKLAGI